MVFILVYYCLYGWAWYLQAYGNCSQGWTRLVEVYNFISCGLGWFLLIFPWCQAKRHWVLRSAMKYIHRYTSNWLKWCQLAYQKLLKTWHHFLEFSRLFKGTVNLVYVHFWPMNTVNWKWNNLSVNNCWKNYLCHAQSRCPNRLTKTIVC